MLPVELKPVVIKKQEVGRLRSRGLFVYDLLDSAGLKSQQRLKEFDTFGCVSLFPGQLEQARTLRIQGLGHKWQPCFE